MLLPPQKIYDILLHTYGDQQWWPAETKIEIVVGAILTQNTSWNNVEKALYNLRDSLDPETLYSMDNEELAEKIRPSGFYTIKAQRLKNFLIWFKTKSFSFTELKKIPVAELRKELLNINGIGGETADAIILYAVEKPVFVIDTYTRRIFSRIGYDVPKKYEDFQALFHSKLQKNTSVYNQYHALLVQHAKVYCRTKPRCTNCPLKTHCQYGQTL